MNDVISRQAAVEALEIPKVIDLYDHYWNGRNDQYKKDVDAIADLPSAQPEQKKGKWLDYSDEGYVECPFCHSATNCDGNKDELHFCFSCGADMRTKETDCDYERAVEQLEHDMLYEPTFNQDGGSM